jgi:maltose alpha-D-glucosyltransferase/alpha-amylase
MPKWLSDAVFYEIYPQSFKDTNADGIGDFEGIIEKLDYIHGLGCNALWLNPCFDSPFKDAGYDVRDYKKVAARYGTNADLYRLFKEAHHRGMHVLLDLVPGHTSEEHEWFLQSQKNETNAYSDRYIWTDFAFHGTVDTGYPCVGGESERNATYLLNFFKCQPALNYGWLAPTKTWQKSTSDPSAVATVEAMKDVMRFWMDHGCDGFRVDMAASLVKGDDAQKSGTSKIWQNVRAMLDRDYPEAVLVSEWSCPPQALRAGFHADFFLNEVGNGYSTLVRDYENHSEHYALGLGCFSGQKGDVPAFEDHSFFRKDAGGDITNFLSPYLHDYNDTNGLGYISMISCNHDTIRPRFSLDERELKLFYAFLFTMPGVPFLYYGDEIGMRFLNLPTKEGGYFRTGSRTPMQWTHGKNLGFSTGSADSLYLPVDSAADAPTVEAQEKDPDSLLSTVKALLALRAQNADLQSDCKLEILHAEKEKLPFVYRRGSHVMAINPSSQKVELTLECGIQKIEWSVGSGKVNGSTIVLGPQSFLLMQEA